MGLTILFLLLRNKPMSNYIGEIEYDGRTKRVCAPSANPDDFCTTLFEYVPEEFKEDYRINFIRKEESALYN